MRIGNKHQVFNGAYLKQGKPKMTEICKCGHEGSLHSDETENTHIGMCYATRDCKCKKFEAQKAIVNDGKGLLMKTKKGCGKVYNQSKKGRNYVICGVRTPSHGLTLCPKCKPQNHSHRIGSNQSGDTPEGIISLKSETSGIHSQHAASDTLGGSSEKKHADTFILSEKIQHPPSMAYGKLKVKDVKEFIQRLKKLLTNGDYYGDRSFTDLFKKIDKLAGDLK